MKRRAFTSEEIEELRKFIERSPRRSPYGSMSELAKRLNRSPTTLHVKLSELRRTKRTHAELMKRLHAEHADVRRPEA
jgi:hypothetical protein